VFVSGEERTKIEPEVSLKTSILLNIYGGSPQEIILLPMQPDETILRVYVLILEEHET
jgi:hypothetical protein